MALALTGHFDDARREARHAIDVATDLDDEALLARSLQRMSYVEYQAGSIADAEWNAREAARLAKSQGAWFHFMCAQSLLHVAAVDVRDDHAAALWHAQQIEWAAERTGDRRHRALYALSAQYVLEVERGRRDRALVIESELPLHSGGFRDELECCIALATALELERRVLGGLSDFGNAGSPRSRSFRAASLECRRLRCSRLSAATKRTHRFYFARVAGSRHQPPEKTPSVTRWPTALLRSRKSCSATLKPPSAVYRITPPVR